MYQDPSSALLRGAPGRRGSGAIPVGRLAHHSTAAGSRRRPSVSSGRPDGSRSPAARSHGRPAARPRHLARLPLATARLRRSWRLARQVHATYDVVLTPTLDRETPRIGWLDPRQDYDTVMGHLLEWVAFAPWQNATGAPAVSLPLATTAAGLPQGMMLGADRGHEAMLLELAHELEDAQPWPLLRDA